MLESRHEPLDSCTLSYVYDKVAMLIQKNFDEAGVESSYGRTRDMAFREVIRILADELNR